MSTPKRLVTLPSTLLYHVDTQVGAPNANAYEGIRREHCEGPDSNSIFITDNYKVHTTSCKECEKSSHSCSKADHARNFPLSE